jgi:hypothetical protein
MNHFSVVYIFIQLSCYSSFFIYFLGQLWGDQIDPHLISFPQIPTRRWGEGCKAPNTGSRPLKVKEVHEGGREREGLQQHLTETTTTTTRIILDTNRKMSTERRFVPPPNNILTGFAMAIVLCTTPRSYAAPLPPSI